MQHGGEAAAGGTDLRSTGSLTPPVPPADLGTSSFGATADDAASRQRSSSPRTWQYKIGGSHLAGAGSGSSTPLRTGAAPAPRSWSGTRSYQTTTTIQQRANLDNALVTAVRQQMERLEDRVNHQLKLASVQGDRSKEASLQRLEEKVSEQQTMQPKLDKKIAQLTGNVKGLSDEMQVQIRRVDMMDERIVDFGRQLTEEFRQKINELSYQLQEVQTAVRLHTNKNEDERSRLELRFKRLEEEHHVRIQGHEELTRVLHTRLESVEHTSRQNVELNAVGGMGGEQLSTELLAMVEQRLADQSENINGLVQEQHELHAKLQEQEERMRGFRTLLGEKEERLQALGEKVDCGDWDSHIKQLRQALQSHKKEQLDAAEEQKTFGRRLEDLHSSHDQLRTVHETVHRTLTQGNFGAADMESASPMANEHTALLQDAVQEMQSRIEIIEEELPSFREMQRVAPHVATLVTSLQELVPQVTSNDTRIEDLRAFVMEHHGSSSEKFGAASKADDAHHESIEALKKHANDITERLEKIGQGMDSTVDMRLDQVIDSLQEFGPKVSEHDDHIKKFGEHREIVLDHADRIEFVEREVQEFAPRLDAIIEMFKQAKAVEAHSSVDSAMTGVMQLKEQLDAQKNALQDRQAQLEMKMAAFTDSHWKEVEVLTTKMEARGPPVEFEEHAKTLEHLSKRHDDLWAAHEQLKTERDAHLAQVASFSETMDTKQQALYDVVQDFQDSISSKLNTVSAAALPPEGAVAVQSASAKDLEELHRRVSAAEEDRNRLHEYKTHLDEHRTHMDLLRKAHEDHQKHVEERWKAHEDRQKHQEDRWKVHDDHRSTQEERWKAHESHQKRLDEIWKVHDEHRSNQEERWKVHEDHKMTLEERWKAFEQRHDELHKALAQNPHPAIDVIQNRLHTYSETMEERHKHMEKRHEELHNKFSEHAQELKAIERKNSENQVVNPWPSDEEFQHRVRTHTESVLAGKTDFGKTESSDVQKALQSLQERLSRHEEAGKTDFGKTESSDVQKALQSLQERLSRHEEVVQKVGGNCMQVWSSGEAGKTDLASTDAVEVRKALESLQDRISKQEEAIVLSNKSANGYNLVVGEKDRTYITELINEIVKNETEDQIVHTRLVGRVDDLCNHIGSITAAAAAGGDAGKIDQATLEKLTTRVETSERRCEDMIIKVEEQLRGMQGLMQNLARASQAA
eukprot:TRINITY_DN4318_c0_g1_i5.p1 TRINITY_DN4318_c0_g1~~TRINITY_DN4318_c0_g1_i5.p1  ORF type:complete len:1250 (+),score=346.62 TRINITY_DN4318_c0_g1_i5:151-3750(+)